MEEEALVPWTARGIVDDRLRFVSACLAGEATMTELCERFGISRKAGYKWLGRYAVEGPSGLADRSHAPLRHGRATDPALVEALLQLKAARPSWGPRKLVARLALDSPAWPGLRRRRRAST